MAVLRHITSVTIPPIIKVEPRMHMNHVMMNSVVTNPSNATILIMPLIKSDSLKMHTNTCRGEKSQGWDKCKGRLSPQLDGRNDLVVLRHITVFRPSPSAFIVLLYNCFSTCAIGRRLLQPARHGPLIGQIPYHAFKKTLLITI